MQTSKRDTPAAAPSSGANDGDVSDSANPGQPVCLRYGGRAVRVDTRMCSDPFVDVVLSILRWMVLACQHGCLPLLSPTLNLLVEQFKV